MIFVLIHKKDVQFSLYDMHIEPSKKNPKPKWASHACLEALTVAQSHS